MKRNGYYWYYINVYEEEHKMHQEFADKDFKTKAQAIEDAKRNQTPPCRTAHQAL